MSDRLRGCLVSPELSLRETVAVIDRNRLGIALVVDADGRLLDTVTDGDLRRALLAQLDFERPVAELLADRKVKPASRPTTAPAGAGIAELLRLMNERSLQHIPILGEDGVVVDLVALRDLVAGGPPVRAVVMAGGAGSRLRPLTDSTPKPMLPVGDRPLLEDILGQLREAGIHRINLATHFEAGVISKHFGDGSAFGVEIEYVREDQPLGTAGALGLLPEGEPLLVMNGDILTRVDYRALFDFHRDQGAEMTVAVRAYEHRVPYGVIEAEGVRARRIVEKPVVRRLISAGIYLLSPEVHRLVPRDRSFDMPELVSQLLDAGRPVVCFPIREYWQDIGKVEDYERARSDIESGRL